VRARNIAVLAVACALALALVTTFAVTKTSVPPPTAPGGAAHPAVQPTPKSTASATPNENAWQPGTAENPVTYVALGDSYAAGQGGGDEQGACLRSPKGYPGLLGRTVGIRLDVNAACSGATTRDVQRKQLGALGPSVQLVTLSVGGNDLNVAALPAVCARQTSSACEKAVRASLKALGGLSGKLTELYRAVEAAAPNARIMVTGYPSFYDVPKTTDKDFATIVAVDAAVIALNDAIKQAVATQQRTGADIGFVDISFAGHGVESKHPWYVLTGLDALHPTDAGYRAYAKAVKKALAQ